MNPKDIRVSTRRIGETTEVRAELVITSVVSVDDNYGDLDEAIEAAKEHCRRSIIKGLYGEIRKNAMEAMHEWKYRCRSMEESERISELMSPLLNAGNDLGKESIDSIPTDMH